MSKCSEYKTVPLVTTMSLPYESWLSKLLLAVISNKYVIGFWLPARYIPVTVNGYETTVSTTSFPVPSVRCISNDGDIYTLIVFSSDKSL